MDMYGNDAPTPRLIMMTEPHDFLPQFTSVIDTDAVSVGIEVLAFHGRMHATGSAKRHPKDSPHAQTGLALAQARAMRAAADELERVARDHIRLADEERRRAIEREAATQHAKEELRKELARRAQEDEEVQAAIWDDESEPVELGVLEWEWEDAWRNAPASDLLDTIKIVGRAQAGIDTWKDDLTVGELVDFHRADLEGLAGVGPTTADRIYKAARKMEKANA